VVRLRADGSAEREGAQVEIGGNERYLPLCRRHFHEARGERLRAGEKGTVPFSGG